MSSFGEHDYMSRMEELKLRWEPLRKSRSTSGKMGHENETAWKEKNVSIMISTMIFRVEDATTSTRISRASSLSQHLPRLCRFCLTDSFLIYIFFLSIFLGCNALKKELVSLLPTSVGNWIEIAIKGQGLAGDSYYVLTILMSSYCFIGFFTLAIASYGVRST